MHVCFVHLTDLFLKLLQQLFQLLFSCVSPHPLPGMRVRLEPSPDAEGSWVVADVGLAYGGVAPKSIMAEKVGSGCDTHCLQLPLQCS